jgi:hypothetical protein
VHLEFAKSEGSKAMAARQRDVDYTQPSARPDAYTGMLVLALVATLTGLVFGYLDYSQYDTKMPNLKGMIATPMGPANPAAAPR